MVVHGGIDGYSRIVVYLKCSNNNREDTVLQLFLQAVNVPSRVRADRGEDIKVADFDFTMW